MEGRAGCGGVGIARSVLSPPSGCREEKQPPGMGKRARVREMTGPARARSGRAGPPRPRGTSRCGSCGAAEAAGAGRSVLSTKKLLTPSPRSPAAGRSRAGCAPGNERLGGGGDPHPHPRRHSQLVSDSRGEGGAVGEGAAEADPRERVRAARGRARRRVGAGGEAEVVSVGAEVGPGAAGCG